MKREPVHSSAIASLGYDARQAILEVEFRSGRTYRYFEVPEFLYQGFVLAASKGDYFRRRINDRYRFEEVQ